MSQERSQQPPNSDAFRGNLLTNGEAVGPSRIASSSSVNGKRGIRRMRRGISNMMMTGNPIAAMRYR